MTPLSTPIRSGRRSALAAGMTLAALVALSGCTENTASAGGENTIQVVSTEGACQVSATEAPSGHLIFNVKNEGGKVTEFYVLAANGVTIVGEVENIGPGLTRDLVVTAAPGQYITSCRPGMAGDGIRAAFTVTDSGADLNPTGANAETINAATARYAAYVKAEAQTLLDGTKQFAAAYKAGDDDAARALYAATRMHWESIEPVAESFGDLDPRLDLREADLEEGQEWTGWHTIEKDLYPPAKYTPLTDAKRQALADQLVADTEELHSRVQDLTYTAAQMGNGAKELLDEVATGKVTGEEEAWSHTDLWDFQANVDGAREVFSALVPVVSAKDPELAQELQKRFDELQAELGQYKQGDGFVSYGDLTEEQVRDLAAAVDALAEPLSHLTATVVL